MTPPAPEAGERLPAEEYMLDIARMLEEFYGGSVARVSHAGKLARYVAERVATARAEGRAAGREEERERIAKALSDRANSLAYVHHGMGVDPGRDVARGWSEAAAFVLRSAPPAGRGEST